MANSLTSRLLVIGALAGFLAACSGLQGDASYPTRTGKDRHDPTGGGGVGKQEKSGGGLFGDLSWTIGGDDEADSGSTITETREGNRLFKRNSAPTVAATGLGVNAYLWRASLDTVSFMPLQSADPVGGVVITDWYADPQSPRERFKLTVYILDKNLRADGVRVAAFRQARQGGEWLDAAVNPDVAIKLENAILVRARQLKVASGG
ncbi:MAG: DUF3576 domain-containing protein [Alphaproteobacteria bacterium]